MNDECAIVHPQKKIYKTQVAILKRCKCITPDTVVDFANELEAMRKVGNCFCIGLPDTMQHPNLYAYAPPTATT